MNATAPTCPLPRNKVIDLYFMEHRAKLLDIAAFLDRIERAPSEGAPSRQGGAQGAQDAESADSADFRIAALLDAVKILLDGQPQRARRVLESLSDPTMEPLASAAGMKGAAGAWPGKK